MLIILGSGVRKSPFECSSETKYGHLLFAYPHNQPLWIRGNSLILNLGLYVFSSVGGFSQEHSGLPCKGRKCTFCCSSPKFGELVVRKAGNLWFIQGMAEKRKPS